MKPILVAAVMAIALPNVAQAAYCVDAQPMSHTTPYYRHLPALLMQHCKVGDTIVLDNVPQVVGIVCDMNKPIVNQGVSVTCTLAQPRELR
jgi:hypothetical protein